MHYLWRIFDSKRELKEHKDKNHRIAGSKMAAVGITNQVIDDDDDNNNT
jgi:hypothetical protein